MRLARLLLALVPVAAGLPNILGCSEKDGTPSGTLVRWTRPATTWDSGISTGDDLGVSGTADANITFTPNDRLRDASLSTARFSVHVEYGEVAMTPAANGVLLADKARTPRLIELVLTDNSGWQVRGDCSQDLSTPALGDSGGVTLWQRCEIALSSGDDNGRVSIDVHGDGRILALGGFGEAELE